MVLGLHDIEDFFPLLRVGVNTSWVVSANVQKNYGVVFGIFEVLSEALEVETLSFGVIVTVVLPFLANNINNTSVKGPSGVWSEDVDIFVGIPVSKERETKAQGACSRNTLGSSDATLFELCVISTVCEGQ